MEAAMTHAHENDVYRKKTQQCHPNASLMYYLQTQQNKPSDIFGPQQQQLPTVLPQQPLVYNANQLNLQPAINNSFGETSIDLRQLDTAQLLALHQQQQAVSLTNSMLPLHQPSLPLLSPPLQSPLLQLLPPPSMLPLPRRPVYSGVNPNYPGLRVVNRDPPMFAVDQFLTPSECFFLIHAAQDSFGPAPVVGKGSGEVSPARTSSTCYLAREDLANLMRKVCLLTGKPMEHCELPQVGRYFSTQQYLQHYDAFDLETEDGQRFAANGGQRTITVLIYLNNVTNGGHTRFPALNIDVKPQEGMALVFFPASIDGVMDRMALHAAMPAIDTKYVSQIWIRQSTYQGQASKRLPVTMGAPLGHDQCDAALLGVQHLQQGPTIFQSMQQQIRL
ncbi:hypothetical protein MPSEU_000167200 [Mayamaea pseudoterrestris]|nr:hypothetical protein MPSEU_000167200 [Mayamaea pseudoterrestris]